MPSMARFILGINSAHADASAVLVGSDGIVAAICEERINRQKHCAGFPELAIREVMRIAGIGPQDLTDIAVARDSSANLKAKLGFVARNPLSGLARAFQRAKVHEEVSNTPDLVAAALGVSASSIEAKFHNVEHHIAHAASAFYTSPFDRATAVTLDGAGDFATGLVATCNGLDIHVDSRSLWPHSAGVFYTTVCQFIGFDRFGEEYKVMGLSAYGKNTFADEMKKLIWFDEKSGIQLGLEYYQHHTAHSTMEIHQGNKIVIPQLWSNKMRDLLGTPREHGAPYTERDHDVAASMQIRFEEVYSELVAHAVQKTGCRDVVLAGGCALNSVANGKLIEEAVIDRAWFHPAASDDGTAAGAALYVMHQIHRQPRVKQKGSAYLGTSWKDDQIEEALVASGQTYEKLSRDKLLETAATALASGSIMGWFQGREEWGPRALGNRSILCNPGWPEMKATLNARIKNREHFRPFAPAVLAERLNECFEGTHEVPFMIIVYKVREEWRKRLSAVTHEDGTGRVQTVTREDNDLYYDLISKFEEKSGVPVLLNTSFNENEPIVHTPAEAIDCFARTKMDCLGIGSFWLVKDQ